MRMHGARASGRPLPVFAWAWFPLLLTACVRVAWLTLFPVDPLSLVDAEGFHLLAANMMAGRGFAIGWRAPFCPNTIRTPLYPLFLMVGYRLLGHGPERVVLLQILLEVVTAANVAALTREVARDTLSRKARALASLGAASLYAFNGTTQRFTGYLLSETLLLATMTVALWLSVRLLHRPTLRRSALAGSSWGLVLLTKPNVLYFAVAVGVLIFLRVATMPARDGVGRRRVLTGGMFWMGLWVLTLPWVVRNRLVAERWVFSTAFEENLVRVSGVATLLELQAVEAEPWTTTWEHVYRGFCRDVGARYGVSPDLIAVWIDGVEGAVPARDAEMVCANLEDLRAQAARAARALVLRHSDAYLRAHLRGVVRSLFDLSHRTWYRVLTGHEWAMTHVVPDIGARVAWSLQRYAVGDAIAAFWQERVVRIPRIAGLLWWGLFAGRGALWGLSLKGLASLRRHAAVVTLLGGCVAYHLLLPGPIAHDRFYAPVVPVVISLVVVALSRRAQNTKMIGY